jgi:hypothetical protein
MQKTDKGSVSKRMVFLFVRSKGSNYRGREFRYAETRCRSWLWPISVVGLPAYGVGQRSHELTLCRGSETSPLLQNLAAGTSMRAIIGEEGFGAVYPRVQKEIGAMIVEIARCDLTSYIVQNWFTAIDPQRKYP